MELFKKNEQFRSSVSEAGALGGMVKAPRAFRSSERNARLVGVEVQPSMCEHGEKREPDQD